MIDAPTKRHANGSIDTADYMALGRKARSDEALRMARATRAAARSKLVQLRQAVDQTITAPNPVRAGS